MQRLAGGVAGRIGRCKHNRKSPDSVFDLSPFTAAAAAAGRNKHGLELFAALHLRLEKIVPAMRWLMGDCLLPVARVMMVTRTNFCTMADDCPHTNDTKLPTLGTMAMAMSEGLV